MVEIPIKSCPFLLIRFRVSSAKCVKIAVCMLAGERHSAAPHELLDNFFCGCKDKSEMRNAAHLSNAQCRGSNMFHFERKFQDKGLEAPCREKPWKSPGTNLRHQIAYTYMYA